MASQETRQLEIFGQKLILETGGTEVDMPGVAAYMLESTTCLLYTSPSPRDYAASRMPSSA